MAHIINGKTFPDYNDYCKTKFTNIEFCCISQERIFANKQFTEFVLLENYEHSVQIRVRYCDITEINGKQI